MVYPVGALQSQFQGTIDAPFSVTPYNTPWSADGVSNTNYFYLPNGWRPVTCRALDKNGLNNETQAPPRSIFSYYTTATALGRIAFKADAADVGVWAIAGQLMAFFDTLYAMGFNTATHDTALFQVIQGLTLGNFTTAAQMSFSQVPSAVSQVGITGFQPQLCFTVPLAGGANANGYPNLGMFFIDNAGVTYMFDYGPNGLGFVAGPLNLFPNIPWNAIGQISGLKVQNGFTYGYINSDARTVYRVLPPRTNPATWNLCAANRILGLEAYYAITLSDAVMNARFQDQVAAAASKSFSPTKNGWTCIVDIDGYSDYHFVMLYFSMDMTNYWVVRPIPLTSTVDTVLKATTVGGIQGTQNLDIDGTWYYNNRNIVSGITTITSNLFDLQWTPWNLKIPPSTFPLPCFDPCFPY